MRMATGDVIIEVDDDVLEFPVGIDEIFESYLYTFKEFVLYLLMLSRISTQMEPNLLKKNI